MKYHRINEIQAAPISIDHSKSDKMQKPHLPPHTKKPSAATNDTPEEKKRKIRS